MQGFVLEGLQQLTPQHNGAPCVQGSIGSSGHYNLPHVRAFATF